MTLHTLAGETRIHSLPGRPKFMLIREIAEIVGIKTDTLQKAFRRYRDQFPEGYFFVLTEAEFLSQFGHGVRTAERKRTDLEQIGMTEKGAILLLSLMTGPDVLVARISLIDSTFARHAAERQALRGALIEDEAKFIGRSTIKAAIKLAALEGWSFSRLAGEATCSMPVLIRHLQAMRLRGFIPQDALLPPVYMLREIAERRAQMAEHLDGHEQDARQLLLNWGA